MESSRINRLSLMSAMAAAGAFNTPGLSYGDFTVTGGSRGVPAPIPQPQYDPVDQQQEAARRSAVRKNRHKLLAAKLGKKKRK
jgi:hypothetical protein